MITRKCLGPIVALLVCVLLRWSFAPMAIAGDSLPMKCAANQDRVWVYDSLGSFDVAAKLKCNETVEIISRVKGFVKIHSASGVEGYVPDSTFPSLPPLPDESNNPAASAASLASAARAAARPAAVSLIPASNPAKTPAAVATVASNVPPAPAPAPATTAASIVASVPVAASVPASPAAVTPARMSAPMPTKIESAPVDIVLTTAAEAPPPVASKPAIAPVKKSAVRAGNSGGEPVATNASTRTAAARTSTMKSNATKSASNKSSASQPPATGSTHSNSVPAAPATAPSNSKPSESTTNLQPARNTPSVHEVAAVVESEDFPDSTVESESADPSCQIFFSAYGLTPDQFKWVTQNRKKKFPNVCPAPDMSRVDFVIIFTHDVDFYGNTLPAPVHTDKNGFSDFSPMSMMDTTVTPISQAEKAKHEYVYVFQMRRGAFDPSRFSPRRRYQFTKAESNSLTSSHASSRTIEDAFHFMEERGPAL